MVLKLDPEVQAALTPMMEAMANIPPVAVGDVAGKRKLMGPFLTQMFGSIPNPGDVASKDYYTTTSDGHQLLLRWLSKKTSSTGAAGTLSPAVVYAHGGGMIMADIQIYNPLLMSLVSQSGVPFLAVEFRPAPENRGPTQAEDVYAALRWLHDHAASLNVDPARLAVMGDSGGGCVAAAVALLARDRALSPPLAKQILIYPMLDDRTIHADPALVPFMIWSYDDNLTAWSAVTGNAVADMRTGKIPPTSPYTAPARLTNEADGALSAAGLPSAYIEVGNLDIFRDEDIEYARKLAVAGVETDLHVRAGCPHGWENIAPQAKVTRVAMADRMRALQSF